jgi:hypothetical protein
MKLYKSNYKITQALELFWVPGVAGVAGFSSFFSFFFFQNLNLLGSFSMVLVGSVGSLTG